MRKREKNKGSNLIQVETKEIIGIGASKQQRRIEPKELQNHSQMLHIRVLLYLDG